VRDQRSAQQVASGRNVIPRFVPEIGQPQQARVRSQEQGRNYQKQFSGSAPAELCADGQGSVYGSGRCCARIELDLAECAFVI
jgi:hypothetical protein